VVYVFFFLGGCGGFSGGVQTFVLRFMSALVVFAFRSFGCFLFINQMVSF